MLAAVAHGALLAFGLILPLGGVSLVVLTAPGVRTALLGAGVVFLAVVGWLTWRSDPAAGKPDAPADAWPVRGRSSSPSPCRS